MLALVLMFQPSLVAAAQSPLEQWRDTHFGILRLPSEDGSVWGHGADPLGIGRPNLLHYALGTDPFNPASFQNPGFEIFLLEDSLYVVFAPNDTDPKAVVVPEVSSDLTTWHRHAPQLLEVTSNPPPGLLLEPGERLFRDLNPAGESRRFLRLRAAYVDEPLGLSATYPVFAGGETAAMLSGVSASGAGALFVVTSLPEHGRLFDGAEAGGAEIVSPGPVGSSLGFVRYVPDAGFTGVDHLRYRVDDGQRISPEYEITFVVSTADTAGAVQIGNLQPNAFLAGAPLYFTLPGAVADGGLVHREILFSAPALSGTLYQVEADGVTLGAAFPPLESSIVGPFTVTNPFGIVAFVPASSASSLAPNFRFRILDSQGISSSGLTVSVPIVTINRAPFFIGPMPHVTGAMSTLTFAIQLPIADPNDPSSSLRTTVVNFPTRGDLLTLSGEVLTPENRFFQGTVVSYSPHDPTQFGPEFDGFTFYASDGEFSTPLGEVVINLTQGNLPPTYIGPTELVGYQDDLEGIFIEFDAEDDQTPISGLSAFSFSVSDPTRLVHIFPSSPPSFLGHALGSAIISSASSPRWTLIYRQAPGFNTENRDPVSLVVRIRDAQGLNTFQEILLHIHAVNPNVRHGHLVGSGDRATGDAIETFQASFGEAFVGASAGEGYALQSGLTAMAANFTSDHSNP